jgi:hypothetical protein
LGEIKLDDAGKAKMPVEKDRNILADVENEPDGEEAGYAVEEGLQKIAQDVAIEQFHKGNCRSWVQIAKMT